MEVILYLTHQSGNQTAIVKIFYKPRLIKVCTFVLVLHEDNRPSSPVLGFFIT